MVNDKDCRYKRVFVIVLDAMGTGEAPDSAAFDNAGADTLGSIARFYDGNLRVPNLESIGLGNLRGEDPLPGVRALERPLGCFGKMTVTSNGNDSIDGHWEMMGLPVRFDMGHCPDGFPQWLVRDLKEFSGRPMLVNRAYSGTDVIRDHGEQAVREGAVILYTSGDSVLQLAAHTDVVPLDELYRLCEHARSLVNGPELVMGRVIARPFVGDDADSYSRTADRRDFGLAPTGLTDMDRLKDAGFDVLAIGKIDDLFSGQGIDRAWHNESNMDGMDHVDEAVAMDFCGLCFANLVDFDTVYGHRRDPQGEGRALMDFDARLGSVMAAMGARDLLMICADHGNDPCYRGTDHTRELVPLLVWSPSMAHPGTDLGTRPTVADLGATVLDNFGVEVSAGATSFLEQIS
ncbi:phosphopentomutase [Atopobiaceae bacterium 24-176]